VLFEVVLIIGSTLLLNKEIQQFSLTAFVITWVTHVAVLLLGDYIQYENKWLKAIKALGLALFIVLVVFGGISFLAITGIADSLWEPLMRLRTWFVGLPPSGWMSRWSVRLGIVLFFSAFLLWSIRDDLAALFRSKRL